MTPKLLTRDDFHDAVFARARGLCVLCGADASDAHHILERKLFPDGGYYLDNGAAVCAACHIQCETTAYTVEEVRKAAKIDFPVMPPGYDYDEDKIDKWGNYILPNGKRMPGPLFNDAGCQAMLKKGGFLDLFVSWVKYPRTPHLPWSPGKTDDDKVIETLALLEGDEIVVTAKMDGENTTMYCDGMHARSLSTSGGRERDFVKALHGQIAHEIPEGFRICGENVYAKHSISYSNLDAYFLVFSIWDRTKCLSWDETLEWCDLLGLTTVPVLYRGKWQDRKQIQGMWAPWLCGDECEGYVVRPAGSFVFSEFGLRCAKFVRQNHVQSNEHWKHSTIVPNKLRPKQS